MKNNSTPSLENRLKKYSALAGSIVAAAGSANAQIVYTDVNPDENIDQVDSVYALDLNNDATVDFNLVAVFASGTYLGGLLNYYADIVAMVCEGSNELNGTVGTNATYAAALDFNDNIDATLNWLNVPLGTGAQAGAMMAGNVVLTGLYSTTIGAGNFIGATDKFLGLRIHVGADSYYGWARLDVPLDARSFTIKDYAYQSISDSAIVAGDDGMGGVGVAENGENLMKMRFNRNIFHLDAYNVNSNGTVEIFNMTGQKVADLAATPGNNTYDLGILQGGIYIVRARFDEGEMTRKFMIR